MLPAAYRLPEKVPKGTQCPCVVLNLFMLCFGQDSSSSLSPGFEYFSPTNASEILDPDLMKIVELKDDDQWELTLAKGDSNKAIEIILFLNSTLPLNFTLKAVKLDAIDVKPNKVSLQFGKEAEKKFEFLWVNVLGNIQFNVNGSTFNHPIGMLNQQSNTVPRFFIDYQGNVSATSDDVNKNVIQTNQAVLPLGQSTVYMNVSITWKDLQTDFIIAFPSSIFFLIRPKPSPSTTTSSLTPIPIRTVSTSNDPLTESTSNAPFSSSTLANSTESYLAYIIAGSILAVILIVGLVVLIVYCQMKKKKTKSPIAKSGGSNNTKSKDVTKPPVVVNEEVSHENGPLLQQQSQNQSEAPGDGMEESNAGGAEPSHQQQLQTKPPSATQKNETNLKTSKPSIPPVKENGQYQAIRNVQEKKQFQPSKEVPKYGDGYEPLPPLSGSTNLPPPPPSI